MKPLRIGFAGTPDFAVPSLEALLAADGAEPVAVWTQPDRPAGRGRRVAMSPVKEVALAAGLPVHQPRTLRDAGAQKDLENAKLDMLVVAAYGLILPQAVLDAPRLGGVNVHASLLPRWRGAAPIQRAIAAGDRVSGVSIMQMTAGLDEGPTWRLASLELAADETGGSLHDRLASLGGRELIAALPDIAGGQSEPRPQDESFATYAAKLSKAESRVDWRGSAAAIERQVRAFNPWPVCDTLYEGRQLRIWAADVLPGDSDCHAPGQVIADDDGPVVACGEGRLLLRRVQLAGGRAIDGADFVNAKPCVGHTLGAS